MMQARTERALRLITYPELCRDCQACTLACSLYHEGECNLSLARLRVLKNMADYKFEIVVCRHCEEPDCEAACPNEALAANDWGIPVINDAECLFCGSCHGACAYNALFYDERSGRYLKCDLCAGREEGPVCAQVCPVGAIVVEWGEAAR
jgi:Fe-S-cluster-containing hydrogenase component 2